MIFDKMKRKGKEFDWKKKLVLLPYLAAAAVTNAQSIIPAQLQTTASTIRDALTGDIAKVIVGCFFAGSCIAYAYNKDNEKAKSKIIAIGIACILLATTQTIISNFFAVGGAGT